jgi:gluconokinase
MGVAGCGKTRVGLLLAKALHASFIEGDDFHPAANVERMAAGIALTDADRSDWLRALAARLELGCAQGERMVLACSALKRIYREQLGQGDPHLLFVHLDGSRALLEQRLAQRKGHFMPPALLDSQLQDLEPPGTDELAFTCDIDMPPEEICAQIQRHLEVALPPTSF